MIRSVTSHIPWTFILLITFTPNLSKDFFHMFFRYMYRKVFQPCSSSFRDFVPVRTLRSLVVLESHWSCLHSVFFYHFLPQSLRLTGLIHTETVGNMIPKMKFNPFFSNLLKLVSVLDCTLFLEKPRTPDLCPSGLLYLVNSVRLSW